MLCVAQYTGVYTEIYCFIQIRYHIYCNLTYCKYIGVYTVFAGWPARHRAAAPLGWLLRLSWASPLASQGLLPVSVGRKKTQTNLSNHIDPNVNCCAMVSRGVAVACVPWGCQVGLSGGLASHAPQTHGQHATSSSKPEGLGGRACALALVWWWACPMGMAQGACTS